MLVEAGVLASGSMKGFIECRNFNRCKRLHPILSHALEILHVRKFWTTYEQVEHTDEPSMPTIILSSVDERHSVDSLLETSTFKKLFQDYDSFTQRTREGHLGDTAKFCMDYVARVNQFHIRNRAVREDDVDLFIYALTSVTDLFFATNRQNYARWMSRYQLDLMNLPATHPGLKEMLADGLFSIRRTDNQFSRLPVDLTLEQTVNADAASRMIHRSHQQL